MVGMKEKSLPLKDPQEDKGGTQLIQLHRNCMW